MATYPLSFLVLHEPFFMHGSNLGTKINARQREIKMYLDDERQLIWVFFKGKCSSIATTNMVGCDFLDIPEEIKKLFDIAAVEAKRGPGRPPKMDEQVEYNSHREAVRQASREANKVKPNDTVTADYLIQEARNQAMGMKFPGTSKAQVNNAHEVGNQTTQPQAKKKPISHEELKAQMDAEKT